MRYASHYVYVSADKSYRQYAVEVDKEHAFRLFPVITETESTVWLGGVILLSTHSKYSLRVGQTFQELINELCTDIKIVGGEILSSPVYAYHLSSLDMLSLSLRPDSRLKRL